VTTQVLRGRVEHDVRTEREGPLQRGGRERGVDQQGHVGVVSHLGQPRDVDDLHQWIGGCLGPDQPGLRSEGRARGRQVGHVDLGPHELPTRQEVSSQGPEAVEEIVREEHVAAGGQGLQVGGPGSDPGREDVCRLSALAGRQGTFQPSLRGAAWGYRCGCRGSRSAVLRPARARSSWRDRGRAPGRRWRLARRRRGRPESRTGGRACPSRSSPCTSAQWATRTSSLPRFRPWNRPAKARGAFSRPSTMLSWYVILPSRTQGVTSSRKS